MGIIRHDDEHKGDIESIIEYPIGEGTEPPEELSIFNELYTLGGECLDVTSVGLSDITFQDLLDSDNTSAIDKVLRKGKVSLEELREIIGTALVCGKKGFLNNRYYFQLPVFIDLPQIECVIEQNNSRYGYYEYLSSSRTIKYKESQVSGYSNLTVTVIEIELESDNKGNYYVSVTVKPNKLSNLVLKTDSDDVTNILDIVNEEGEEENQNKNIHDEVNIYLWDTTPLTYIIEDYYNAVSDYYSNYLTEKFISILLKFYRYRAYNTPLDVDLLKDRGNDLYCGLEIGKKYFNFNLYSLIEKKKFDNTSFNVKYGLIKIYPNISQTYTDIVNSDICKTKNFSPDGCVNDAIYYFNNGVGCLYSEILSNLDCSEDTQFTDKDLADIRSILSIPLYIYTNGINSISGLKVQVNDFSSGEVGFVETPYFYIGAFTQNLNQKFKVNSILQTYINPMFIPTGNFINTRLTPHLPINEFYLFEQTDLKNLLAQYNVEYLNNLLLGIPNLPLVNDYFDIGKNYMIQVHEYMTSYQFFINKAPFYDPIKNSTCSYPIMVNTINENISLKDFYSFMQNQLFNYNSIEKVLQTDYKDFFRYISEDRVFSEPVPYIDLAVIEMNINEGEFFLRIVDIYNTGVNLFYPYMISSGDYIQNPLCIKINDGKIDYNLFPTSIYDDVKFSYELNSCSNFTGNTVFIPYFTYEGDANVDDNLILNMGKNYIVILPVKFTFDATPISADSILYEFSVDKSDIYSIGQSELYANNLSNIPITYTITYNYDICANTLDKWLNSPLYKRLREENLFLPSTNVTVICGMSNLNSAFYKDDNPDNNENYYLNDLKIKTIYTFSYMCYCQSPCDGLPPIYICEEGFKDRCFSKCGYEGTPASRFFKNYDTNECAIYFYLMLPKNQYSLNTQVAKLDEFTPDTQLTLVEYAKNFLQEAYQLGFNFLKDVTKAQLMIQNSGLNIKIGDNFYVTYAELRPKFMDNISIDELKNNLSYFANGNLGIGFVYTFWDDYLITSIPKSLINGLFAVDKNIVYEDKFLGLNLTHTTPLNTFIQVSTSGDRVYAYNNLCSTLTVLASLRNIVDVDKLYMSSMYNDLILTNGKLYPTFINDNFEDKVTFKNTPEEFFAFRTKKQASFENKTLNVRGKYEYFPLMKAVVNSKEVAKFIIGLYKDTQEFQDSNFVDRFAEGLV